MQYRDWVASGRNQGYAQGSSNRRSGLKSRFLVIFGLLTAGHAAGQHAATSDGPESDLDRAVKVSDDVLWRLELDDIAEVRTFRYCGLARGANSISPMILYAYSFIPKNLDRKHQAPMIVLIHGGVHSNHMTGGPANGATIVRELMQQGYVVVAPEYRGSTGYGPAHAKATDYGGKQDDDGLRPRQWVIERYPVINPARVALGGWGDGGMIALFH